MTLHSSPSRLSLFRPWAQSCSGGRADERRTVGSRRVGMEPTLRANPPRHGGMDAVWLVAASVPRWLSGAATRSAQESAHTNGMAWRTSPAARSPAERSLRAPASYTRHRRRDRRLYGRDLRRSDAQDLHRPARTTTASSARLLISFRQTDGDLARAVEHFAGRSSAPPRCRADHNASRRGWRCLVALSAMAESVEKGRAAYPTGGKGREQPQVIGPPRRDRSSAKVAVLGRWAVLTLKRRSLTPTWQCHGSGRQAPPAPPEPVRPQQRHVLPLVDVAAEPAQRGPLELRRLIRRVQQNELEGFLEAEPDLPVGCLGNGDVAALDRTTELCPRMSLRGHGPPGGAGRPAQPNAGGS